MLNILCSSIARAGGIEVPADVRIVPKPINHSTSIIAGEVMRALGRALCRLGDRVAVEKAPKFRATHSSAMR